MDEQSDIEKYNYSEFVGSEEFLTFRTHLPVGSWRPILTRPCLRAMRRCGSAATGRRGTY